MKNKIKTNLLLSQLLIPGFLFVHLSTPNVLNHPELFFIAIPLLMIGGYNTGLVLAKLQS